MRVLVLGGTRFIGLAVVEHLLREGHEVTLLNRGLTSDPFATRVRRVVGDRREKETIARAAGKMDYDAVVDITAYHETETATMVEAFTGRTGHFIHISTAAVYLVRERVYPPYTEDAFTGRLTPKRSGEESSWLYAYHKRRCEEVLNRAWEEQRFPFTSLRLPMVVGPHDYTRRADAYLERLVMGGPLVLPEGGLNSWGFLWVDDLAAVLVENLANNAAVGRAYNLAQREATSLRQLVELAAAAMDRQPQLLSLPTAWLHAVGLGTSFSPYTHDQDMLLDCRMAEEDLLFRPTHVERWVELLVGDFLARWDGVPRAFAGTRSFELTLAREVGKIRLPSFASAASDVAAR